MNSGEHGEELMFHGYVEDDRPLMKLTFGLEGCQTFMFKEQRTGHGHHQNAKNLRPFMRQPHGYGCWAFGLERWAATNHFWRLLAHPDSLSFQILLLFSAGFCSCPFLLLVACCKLTS